MSVCSDRSSPYQKEKVQIDPQQKKREREREKYPHFDDVELVVLLTLVGLADGVHGARRLLPEDDELTLIGDEHVREHVAAAGGEQVDLL